MNTAYSPYGYRRTQPAPITVLGFTGQFLDGVLQCHALGNGRRLYSPCLMRFISPDVLSPFLKGGINAYAYCLNDPVNGLDPTGNWPIFRNGARPVGRLVQRVASLYKSLTEDRGLTNNQYWNMAEEMAHAKAQVKKASTQYRVVTSKSGFEQLDPGLNHKFVFTQEEKFVVFSSRDDPTMPSHGSLAEFSGLGYGTKGLGESVISAGYVFIGDGGKISLNNHSGHFQPPFENLYKLSGFLEGIGVEVNYIRAFGS
ncbi:MULTISPECIES: RHS repeat-associated core domain-containing protein [Pseudomonas]|uniref:RHS repeat-associated core domain-containing protein n=1 Tax=Pseudomonas mosselii TaxID=78327 RepID=A0A5R8Z0F8_9PSED|nr:RHS repeat-associated core domain-containing protein [Pseudomonas mosselii]TLP59193.1 RHS repeat-associated core domain-containing protein [Pseudomonas mosselii]